MLRVLVTALFALTTLRRPWGVLCLVLSMFSLIPLAWGQFISNCNRFPEQFWQLSPNLTAAQALPPFTLLSPTESGQNLACNSGDSGCQVINVEACQRAARGEELRRIRFSTNLNTPLAPFAITGQGINTLQPTTLLWVQVNGNCTVPTDGEISSTDATRKKITNSTLKNNFTEFRVFTNNTNGRDLIIPTDLSGDEDSFALAPILLDPNLGICPKEGESGKSVSTLAFCYAINLAGGNVGQRNNNQLGLASNQDNSGGFIVSFETQTPDALGTLAAKSLNQRVVLSGDAPKIENGAIEIRYTDDINQFTADSCESWSSFQTLRQDYSSETGQPFQVEIRNLDPAKQYSFCARAISCLDNKGPFTNMVIESPHIEYDFFALYPDKLALIKGCQQTGPMPWIGLIAMMGWLYRRFRLSTFFVG